jgi:hypothetical protein
MRNLIIVLCAVAAFAVMVSVQNTHVREVVICEDVLQNGALTPGNDVLLTFETAPQLLIPVHSSTASRRPATPMRYAGLITHVESVPQPEQSPTSDMNVSVCSAVQS